MIDVKISQQGLKSTFEKTVDPETGEVTRTLIDQELPSDNLTEETASIYNRINPISE
jgi:hypothetical protein